MYTLYISYNIHSLTDESSEIISSIIAILCLSLRSFVCVYVCKLLTVCEINFLFLVCIGMYNIRRRLQHSIQYLLQLAQLHRRVLQ